MGTKTKTKKIADSEFENKPVEIFLEEKLSAFFNRKRAEPFQEKVEDTIRKIEWRWFINRFFFIERGCTLDKAKTSYPAYMSLVEKRGEIETELAIANINLSPEWRVLSVDTNKWSENWLEDVERSESAVIRSMLKFLIGRKSIVPDI